MTDPLTPSVVPAEPVRLRIGDREIPVPPHPLSRDSRKSRHIKLVFTEPDLCVLDLLPASLWGMSALAAVMCAAAGSVGFLGIMCVRGGGWALIISGIVLILFGIALLAFFCVVIKRIVRGKGPLRYTFDRANGKLLIDYVLASARIITLTQLQNCRI